MRSRGVHSLSHALAVAMCIAAFAIIVFILVGGAGKPGAM